MTHTQVGAGWAVVQPPGGSTLVCELNATRYDPGGRTAGNSPETWVPSGVTTRLASSNPPTVTCVGFWRFAPFSVTTPLLDTSAEVMVVTCANTGRAHATSNSVKQPDIARFAIHRSREENIDPPV